MVAEIWWEGIRFAVRKDQRADGVEESTRDEQGHGSRVKLSVDGTDQENNDPTHQEERGVRHPDGDPAKENGFKRDEENCQAPDDPK